MEEKSNVAKVQKSIGTYKFRIEGYSGLSTRVGESVESPEFFICGHQWQLRIFPGGSLEAHKGYISYYLASKSNRVARATYKLAVVNQIIGGIDETFASSGVRVFEAKGVQVDGWGRDKFMLNTMLYDQDFGFCVDDAVIFKVEISVCGELEPCHSMLVDNNDIFANSAISLAHCMKTLFLEAHATDVDIVVCGSSMCLEDGSSDSAISKCSGTGTGSSSGSPSSSIGHHHYFRPLSESEQGRVGCHRCVLMARSPVFKAMLSHNMMESLNGRIIIPDFSLAVVRIMLHFIYSGELPESNVVEEHGEALLAIALKYQVAGLIQLCEVHFAAQLSEDNVVELLLLADGINSIRLKEKALQLIALHSSKIMQSKSFQLLQPSSSSSSSCELLQEVHAVIDAANKRRGCRGIVEKERRFNSACCIM